MVPHFSPLLFFISAPSYRFEKRRGCHRRTVPVQILEKWRSHLAELASFVCSPPCSAGRAVVLCFEAKQSRGEQPKKNHQGTRTEPDPSKIKAGIRASWHPATYALFVWLINHD